MSNKNTTYDPSQVATTMGGGLITGFGDGSMIETEYDEDQWSLKTGADGENVRAKNLNKAGTIKITLLQSSDANILLMGFWSADQLNNGGKVPFLCKDGSGTSVVAAEQAWIQKLPKVVFAKDVEMREWTIRTGNLKVVVGGNNS